MKRMIRCVVALGLVFVLCSCNRSLYIDDAVFQENFTRHKELFDTFREYVNKEFYKNDDITLESIYVGFSPDGDSYEVSCNLGGENVAEYSLSPAQEQAVSVVPEIFADITKQYDQFDLIDLSLYYDGGKLTIAQMYIWFYDAHYYKGYILVVDQGCERKEILDEYDIYLSDNWYLHELAYPD